MKVAAPLFAFVVLGAATGNALAHASDRGHVLLLPTGYYLTGGAIAVAASFLALTVVPPTLLDRLASQRLHLFRVGTGLRPLVSLASFLFLAVLVAGGFLGSRDPLSNPLPLTIWTLLWVGLTLVQGLIGNIWAWINPWHGPVRLAETILGAGTRSTRLPAAIGYWPAVLLFFGFAWFELIYPAPDDPARLALAVAIYWAFNFLCMLIFGYDTWSRRGECLSVFFGMIARLSIFELAASPADHHRLSLCWPGAKLHEAVPLPLSGVLFLLLALASVSFDGLSKTFFWLGLNGINPLEFPGRSALIGIGTTGLLLTFAVLAAVFLLAVFAGERLAGGANGFLASAGLLVWSIVPIALAYHFSHYLTALVVNGQYAAVALSDPLSLGWNLFGTAHMQVTPGIVAGAGSAKVLWNLQAGAIIVGHVLAVLIAHMLAARLHASPKSAALSQAPLAFLMVAYTVFGLWLLSTPTAG
ncbi:hypothetical protein SAMN04488498_104260 [Mesorhizobium albiziae]|uniref:Uncharacterized protein n=1 Tax=Neomesorhizobium albiziae TaxID=335020 RepID=A0A1I3Y7F0_9HYPH|nr:hypothetical protein [Mesorhizobium albiziae]GLS30034.1 hypothetical protein GCM10007937_17420 [Mesorhizobium albiziae]SFK27794.1 hypothetical protein SAMN04488498_104260 [Mesorhizobium albiziae]